MTFEFPSRHHQLSHAASDEERQALLEQRDIELEDYLATVHQLRLMLGNEIVVQITPDTQNTSSTSWQDVLVSSDAYKIEFTKVRADSAVFAFIAPTAYCTGNTGVMEVGLEYNSTDHVVATMYLNEMSSHKAFSGMVAFTDLGAGTHTMTLRYRPVSGAGQTMTFDLNDRITVHLREVPR